MRIAPDAAEPLRVAAAALQSYLRESMKIEVPLDTAPVDDWAAARNTIVAGVLPGCGDALRASKDYRLTAAPDRIAVCGFDDCGAMYGLYHLWERLSLREAPILPRRLDTVRHSKFQARMVLSGLGWMEFPDQYLATLPR